MQDRYLVHSGINNYEWVPICFQCNYIPTTGDVLIRKYERIRCKRCGWAFNAGNTKHIIQNSTPFAEVENQDYPERDYRG
ncbi:hypothetical protein KA005_25050 [bacterium]|nr:hypothetical protein [bacterium]